jgi:hypothetical protein
MELVGREAFRLKMKMVRRAYIEDLVGSLCQCLLL